ncbi:hypothetical protein [Actinomadura sp. 6N118]|uniref:hypothetical protein n=1 Tax=Actinomadura sp. 6N118 TaxID=3375151 RepID=UPI00379A8B86
MTTQPKEFLIMTSLTSPVTATTAVVGVPVAAPPPQQAPQQVPGGPEALSIVIILLAWLVYHFVKVKKQKPGPLVITFIMGVLLSGSVIGATTLQVSGSLGNSLANVFTSVTAPVSR